MPWCPAKLKDMDGNNRAMSSVTGFSNNRASLSTSKKERTIAQILATKFHTEPADRTRIRSQTEPCYERPNHKWARGRTLQTSCEKEMEQKEKDRDQT
jgi:hypothetical protein